MDEINDLISYHCKKQGFVEEMAMFSSLVLFILLITTFSKNKKKKKENILYSASSFSDLE